jgi:large conductance mechanosensitive channel
MVKQVNRIKSAFDKPAAAASPTTQECPYCVSTISLRARRCPNCTSELGVAVR